MYNKLFTKILDSSIWLEPEATRIVWVTCIAAMDEDGFCCFASPANLARRANVELADALTAIATLESPDLNSSDPEHGGRRLERVEGGWMVLNANKYRDIVTRSVARAKTRDRVAKHRAIKAGNAPVTAANGLVTPSEAVSGSGSDTHSHTTSASEEEDPEKVLGARAAAFLDTFAALYAKHRHGAKMFRRRPALDWDSAKTLCQTWDDARLVKMAEIFLTTDDDWIAQTDRGFRVFVARAQWCDERLAAWEAKRRAS